MFCTYVYCINYALLHSTFYVLRNVRDIFLKKMATGGVQYFCCLP